MSGATLSSEEMPLPPASDPGLVFRELWISFIGLTRSHLAALQIIGTLPQVKVIETSVNSFIAGDLDGNIAVSLDTAGGRGSYELKSCGEASDKGSWQLHADGTACVDDGKNEEMELAVELFAQKLVAARLEGATL